MNADDRQVIREALDNLYPSERETIEDQQSFDKLKDKAIALLDKPQPESDGDADDLAVSIAEAVWEAEETHPKNISYEPWKIDIKKAIAPILQAFASRIRAESNLAINESEAGQVAMRVTRECVRGPVMTNVTQAAIIIQAYGDRIRAETKQQCLSTLYTIPIEQMRDPECAAAVIQKAEQAIRSLSTGTP